MISSQNNPQHEHLPTEWFRKSCTMHVLIPSPGEQHKLAEVAIYGVIGPGGAELSTLYRLNSIIITRFKN